MKVHICTGIVMRSGVDLFYLGLYHGCTSKLPDSIGYFEELLVTVLSFFGKYTQ